MVISKILQKIEAKFRGGHIETSVPAETPASPKEMSELEMKLRRKYEEAKQRQGEIGPGIIKGVTFTQDEIDKYSRIIKKIGILNSKEYRDKVHDADGNLYDVTLRFYGGKCEIISDLFPQPFYIVPDESLIGKLQGRVYLVQEFFNILNLANQFEGNINFQ